MRFDHDGMTLWYNTPDAPSPSGHVAAGTDVTVTIGVQPPDASHRIEMLYRIDGGETQVLAATWLRNDVVRGTQYFQVRFPSLRVGDTVEYFVVCRCAGRQVPASEELTRFPLSFRVVPGEKEAAPGARATDAAQSALRSNAGPLWTHPIGGALRHVPDVAPISESGRPASAEVGPGRASTLPSSPFPSPQPIGSASTHSVVEPIAAVESSPCVVEGRVASPDRAGIGGLRVLIVDKNVGQDVPLAEGTTDERGNYRVRFPTGALRQRDKELPDLQARVFTGEVFLAASGVRYNAGAHETLDVRLPPKATALPSEHETLLSTLSAHHAGALHDLEESDERQDITYLANKTGWDARAVALAALADRFSTRTGEASDAAAIPPSFFYALFRAGLPADEDMLFRADVKTLESVWKTAAEQGIIPRAAADQIPNVAGRFQALSAEKLLTAPALVGASSLREMLDVSRLSDVQQRRFAELYALNRADLETFWKAVGDDPVFGSSPGERSKVAGRLRIDGKLGFLTVNNARLMQKVHTVAGAEGLSDLPTLAQQGYYRADLWRQLLTADVPIPKEIPGNTAETRRANYAAYLAAQVRLSYPTAAIAEMVRGGELPLTGAADDAAGRVHAFLTAHQGRFELAIEPIERYLARNNVQAADETVEQVKRLQRVYQITPSDAAMAGLMRHGMTSAHEVVRYDRGVFVQSFAGVLGGTDQAAQVYERSVQIHNTVLNVVLSYLHARTAPAIGVHSPASVLDPVPAHAEDVIAYATLEGLFGSMDFCACEHCRSLLSPAAYLVDLLMFLDQPNPPEGTESPQSVLLDRRPDLQYLPLTCENTNTALPYIDVVNEALEYFIANKSQKLSLKDYQGHDTDGVAPEDLLASPQSFNEPVRDEAYRILREDQYFPPPMPFHQPLERLRRIFDKFDVPLPLAMERLRKSDELERGVHPYGWRDIWMEELGISRADYTVLTDATAVALGPMYGFPAATPGADVVSALSSANQFARRLDITYEELIALLRTQFINPHSHLIPRLERLGVPFTTLKALKDGALTDAAFDALLPTGILAPDPAAYGGDIKAWVRDDVNYGRIMGLITFAIPAGPWAAGKAYAVGDCVRPTSSPVGSSLYFECTTAGASAVEEPGWPATPGSICTDGTVVWTCRDALGCSIFEQLAFRYSDPAKLGQNIGVVEFVRMLRFIRLWKTLGWTVEQTDAAICALYRADLAQVTADDFDTVAKLDIGFQTLLPRLGVVARVMRALDLTARRDLLPLLACWSPIGTHGESALYRQMFLSPTILSQDRAFAADGYGAFLTDPTKMLGAHAEAVRAAFNLTSDEYSHVFAALGYDASTPLTVPNISAIFRRGWLARKLKVSVRELLLLTQFAGLDPFAAPTLTRPAIVELITLVQAMRDRSLKPAVALYLIWNQDLSGRSVPTSDQVAAFARTLRASLAAVETEFAVVDDPDGAIAQSRMATVYGTQVAALFFSLLNGTLTVEVGFGDPGGTLTPGPRRQAIEAASGKNEDGAPRITYDRFRKRLAYSGVLTAPVRDAIKTAAGVGASDFATAVDALYSENRAVVDPLFARYPELGPPHDAYIADTTGAVTEKRARLLAAILPELIHRRKRQQALQLVSTEAGTDLGFAQACLDPAAAPFPLHAAGQVAQPALEDLLAVEAAGLDARFFANDTATGVAIAAPPIAARLDYDPALNPLPDHPTQGSAISGLWTGWLEGPENVFLNLRIEADAGAAVTLSLDGKHLALAQSGTTWTNTEAIEVRAGTLYPLRLSVEKVRERVRVLWEWQPKGQGRAVIPARHLYPATRFATFTEAYVRLLKVASLATGIGLATDELAYFATHPDYQIAGDGWLNALPVSGNPAAAVASAVLKPFAALLDFARIKAEVAPDDESLLAVLQDPAAATQSADSLLFALTRWSRASLLDLLAHLGGSIAGLGGFELFRRVCHAFELVQQMGISAVALIRATTNAPSADTVRDLQAALRARYDAPSWRDVIRPINDAMRSLQRDALVAYILHQMRSHPASAHINTQEKLFEYFLMDVQMDPCMLTSRIRHALSTVQLFTERCLMNLEPRVSPAAINAGHWQWMKRYRVWEANRKVYLFAENWLEPELRDDQSPFFKEAMSELLQGDITEERAAVALLNYLAKLDEVAKLEPCGIHYVPADPARRKGEISHVVARSVGASRKYYYRRLEGGAWRPWEQIKLDIEDDPVIPVVWGDRLFLFWLRILKKGPDKAGQPFSGQGDLVALKTSDIKTEPPAFTVQAILCWSEHYNGKWQPTRTSDVSRPLTINDFAPHAFDRSKLKLSVLFWTKGGLRVIVSYDAAFGTSFFLHNAFSTPELREGKKEAHFAPKRMPKTATESLEISYSEPSITNVVLHNAIEDRVIQPNHPVEGKPWGAPFFYEDARYVFYVTTADQLVSIRQWNDFSISETPPAMSVTLAPLVLQPLEIIPDLAGPIISQPGFGSTDPSPIEMFVTEDAYIHRAIGTGGTVNYGDTAIGLAGSQIKTVRTR
ncbi:MAG TPA: neuraminidase-like domain-containing protein [Herpetosiphonaceae bacterium]|nr:neuraminidase-like domain-containing protein [Herpetosiphonaceae bacterium]